MLTTEQRLRMLETPQTTFDLVIDTDAYNEIDDQFAISYALRAQDRLHLLALCAALIALFCVDQAYSHFYPNEGEGITDEVVYKTDDAQIRLDEEAFV